MASRQVIWARKARAALITQLGGKCRRCGAVEPLELDCIQPMGHEHHACGFVGRTTFYRLQAKHGNLQLLCSDCHTVKTAADIAAQTPTTSLSEIEGQPY